MVCVCVCRFHSHNAENIHANNNWPILQDHTQKMCATHFHVRYS